MSTQTVFIQPSAHNLKIWGLSPTDRIQKQLLKINQQITFLDTLDDSQKEPCLILLSDVVYDSHTLQAMLNKTNQFFVNDKQQPVGAHVTSHDFEDTLKWLHNQTTHTSYDISSIVELGESYRDELRKKANPYAIIINGSNTQDIEWFLFKASYKGITDLVTKYAWPVPAFYVTRLCAFLHISPNMVTSVGAALVIYALYCFWIGDFWLGLVAGWMMTFLDTVDGKLARTTLTSSKWGNIFDHGIDLIHPPFWYMAWGFGLVHYGTALQDDILNSIIITMFASYIVGRLFEGYFIRRFGIHIHVWRKPDSFFRLICARRNPNMIILTLSMIAMRPDIGLITITIWHCITLVVHSIQIVQAEISKSKGYAISSWLTQ